MMFDDMIIMYFSYAFDFSGNCSEVNGNLDKRPNNKKAYLYSKILN